VTTGSRGGRSRGLSVGPARAVFGTLCPRQCKSDRRRLVDCPLRPHERDRPPCRRDAAPSTARRGPLASGGCRRRSDPNARLKAGGRWGASFPIIPFEWTRERSATSQTPRPNHQENEEATGARRQGARLKEQPTRRTTASPPATPKLSRYGRHGHDSGDDKPDQPTGTIHEDHPAQPERIS